MRMRNVKNADKILLDSKYYVKESDINNIKFDNDNEVINLEIGMGKGDFLINLAKLNPNINYIGIERCESVLVRAVQKLDEEELNNIKVICIDAINVGKYINKKIDTLYLNFSDPWPKKRHAKRRLTYKTFLEEYDKIFKRSPKIIMKTDNDLLFESTLINLNNYGYIFDEVYLDLWKENIFNIRTEYETKFGNMGFKIKYIKAHKEVEKK